MRQRCQKCHKVREFEPGMFIEHAFIQNTHSSVNKLTVSNVFCRKCLLEFIGLFESWWRDEP